MKNFVIAIVGASLGGYHVAKGLRENNYEGNIILFGQEDYLPYERPPLSKSFLTSKTSEDQVFLTSENELNDLSIEFHKGVKVLGIDSGNNKIFTQNNDEINYDIAVIATGCYPRIPIGVRLSDRIITFRNLNDSKNLKAALEKSSHLIIIGAGFIGVEIASSAKSMGRDVTLVDLAPNPLEPVLGPEVAGLLKKSFDASGIKMKLESKIEQVYEKDGEVVVACDNEIITGDYCVVATGVNPSVDWIKDSNISLVNGISCNRYLTATKDVYAIGDVARFEHFTLGRSLRIEHYVNATESADTVVHNILNEKQIPYQPVPYFWSDFLMLKLQVLGIPKPYDQVTIFQKDHDTLKGTVVIYSSKGKTNAIAAISKPRIIGLTRKLVDSNSPLIETKDFIEKLI